MEQDFKPLVPVKILLKQEKRMIERILDIACYGSLVIFFLSLLLKFLISK